MRLLATLLGLIFFACGPALAQNARKTGNPPLRQEGTDDLPMPEMRVEGSKPWLYAEIPNARILSLYPEKETRVLVRRLRDQLSYLRFFQPPGETPKIPEPAIVVFIPTNPDESKNGLLVRYVNSRYWVNEDTLVIYQTFPGSTRSTGTYNELLPTYVKFLHCALLQSAPNDSMAWYSPELSRMAARLVTADDRRAIFSSLPEKFISPSENEERRADPQKYQRDHEDEVAALPPLIPLGDFFAAAASPQLKGKWDRDKYALFNYQLRLFAYWAFWYDKGKHRDAFHRFAQAVQYGPLTEELFREHFGLSYAEAEARLAGPVFKRYSTSSSKLELRRAPDSEDTKPVLVRPATESEARQMLAVVYTLAGESRGKRPAVPDRLLKAANLLAELPEDSKDPGLLATRGFLALARQDIPQARTLLEKAVEAGSDRLRIHVTLSRLRFIEAINAARATGKQLNEAQVKYVLAPLNGVTRPRFDPRLDLEMEIDVYAHSVVEPPAALLAEFTAYARRHPRVMNLSLCVAYLYQRIGQRSEASRLVELARQWNTPVKPSADPIADIMSELDLFKTSGPSLPDDAERLDDPVDPTR